MPGRERHRPGRERCDCRRRAGAVSPKQPAPSEQRAKQTMAESIKRGVAFWATAKGRALPGSRVPSQSTGCRINDGAHVGTSQGTHTRQALAAGLQLCPCAVEQRKEYPPPHQAGHPMLWPGRKNCDRTARCHGRWVGVRMQWNATSAEGKTRFASPLLGKVGSLAGMDQPLKERTRSLTRTCPTNRESNSGGACRMTASATARSAKASLCPSLSTPSSTEARLILGGQARRSPLPPPGVWRWEAPNTLGRE